MSIITIAYCYTCNTYIIDYLMSYIINVCNVKHLFCRSSVLLTHIMDVAHLIQRLFSCISTEQYMNVQRKFLDDYTQITSLHIENDVTMIYIPNILRVRFIELLREESPQIECEVDFLVDEILHLGFLQTHHSHFNTCQIAYIWLCFICNNICYDICCMHQFHMKIVHVEGSP